MAIAFPHPEYCTFVLVDVQERLCRAMSELEAPLRAMTQALQIMPRLNVDVVVTEQYPKGLGRTLAPLQDLLPAGTPVFAKTAFSCWGAAEFAAWVGRTRPQALVLAGMETHVCVQQTAIEARRRGFGVILLRDAVCSRHSLDRDTALDLMRTHGVQVTTLEGLVFDWLGDSQHPAFKAVSQVVK
jgi:nicotinamidase-related amidase